MSNRHTLQTRRAHELIDFEFRNLSYVLGVGRYPDGELAEIFIDCAKASTDAANDARDGAVCLSLALQHGTPANAIRAAVTRDENGNPAGVVGCVLDLLAGGDRS